MPSEKIVSSRFGEDQKYYETETSEPKTIVEDSFVQVQWHRETGIDVGIMTLKESDDQVENDRLMVWLDRRGVNALLRALKKAGAQTFGRDEW